MELTPTKKYPLGLTVAYGVFAAAACAQYFLYWLIGRARALELIDPKTMSNLENMVFDAAPVILFLAVINLLIFAHTAPDPQQRAIAKWLCAVAPLSLLPQIVVGILTLMGFKDS